MSKYKFTLYPDLRQFIESQIRYFHENKRQLNSLKNNMIPSQISRYGSHESIGFDSEKRPTEDISIKIASDRYIFQLELAVNNIEAVYNSLSDMDKEIIRLKYWDNTLTPEGIALKVGIDKTTMYYRLNNILVEIARRLGYVDL